jgi:cell division protein FtsQ
VVVALVCGSIILTYTPMFGARSVEVEGTRRLAPKQVMRIAGLAVGTNVMHLDTGRAEARLEDEPWIHDATVSTELPGTITITVRERVPALVLDAPDGRRLLAADGTDLGHAAASLTLPTVTAIEGSTLDEASLAQAGRAVAAMAPALRTRVDAVVVSLEDGLTLTIDGDVEVRFGGPDEAVAKAQALRAILDHADERGASLLSIDVSVPAAPTARFVGSQQPASVPDPSADRATSGGGSGGGSGNGDGDQDRADRGSDDDPRDEGDVGDGSPSA